MEGEEGVEGREGGRGAAEASERTGCGVRGQSQSRCQSRCQSWVQPFVIGIRTEGGQWWVVGLGGNADPLLCRWCFCPLLRGVRSLSLTSLSVPPKDPNGVRLAAQMKMPRFSMMERVVEDLGGRWKLHGRMGHR